MGASICVTALWVVVFVNLCSDFDEYLQQNINALDLPSQTLRYGS